jgi:hypothetical protein
MRNLWCPSSVRKAREERYLSALLASPSSAGEKAYRCITIAVPWAYAAARPQPAKIGASWPDNSRQRMTGFEERIGQFPAKGLNRSRGRDGFYLAAGGG